jgi:hypothetical protein
MAATNNAPSLKWLSETLACGTRRQRLILDGAETPFFIDTANGVRAHRVDGFEHGLMGAGMGPEIRPGLRIAAVLRSGSNVRQLKHVAEQMAASS